MTKDYTYFDSIDSTLDEALRRLQKNKGSTPFLLQAATQTHGRGRRGSSWNSLAGHGLYLTLVLNSEHPVKEMLPIKIAVLLCSWLKESFAINATIKWPNDILFSGKKLAGILCESHKLGDKNHVLVGIGINIKKQNSPDIPYATVGLKELVHIDHSCKDLGQIFFHFFKKTWTKLNKEKITKLYAEHQMHLGHPWIQKKNPQTKYRYSGIDAKGFLLLQSCKDKNKCLNLVSAYNDYTWYYQKSLERKNHFLILYAFAGQMFFSQVEEDNILLSRKNPSIQYLEKIQNQQDLPIFIAGNNPKIKNITQLLQQKNIWIEEILPRTFFVDLAEDSSKYELDQIASIEGAHYLRAKNPQYPRKKALTEKATLYLHEKSSEIAASHEKDLQQKNTGLRQDSHTHKKIHQLMLYGFKSMIQRG